LDGYELGRVVGRIWDDFLGYERHLEKGGVLRRHLQIFDVYITRTKYKPALVIKMEYRKGVIFVLAGKKSKGENVDFG